MREVHLTNGEQYVVSWRNLSQHLLKRAGALLRNSKIEFSPALPNTFQLALVGDCSNGITKLGIYFINAKKFNNSQNITLLGLFDGPNNYKNLRLAFDYFSDEFNVFFIDDVSFSVQLFVSGDFKFLYLLYGLKGASSNFPCFYCCSEVVKKFDKWSTQTFSPKSLSKMDFDFKEGLYGQKALPIFKIDVGNVVPPLLHIFLGLGQNKFDCLFKNVPIEIQELILTTLET